MLSTAVGGYQLFAAVALQEARFATSLVAGVRQHMPAAPISADVVAEPQTTGRKTTVPVARRGVGVPEILPQTASRTTAEGSVPQQPVEQPADTNAPHAPTDNRDGATVDVPPAGDETRSTVSATPPASEPDVDSRPNWTSAGDAGVAIGQKSKDAGLATAGFFTRFARRVAGKF
jgi:hypothetical protein